MNLSATRLRTYLTCPRRYRYAYVDEIPELLSGAVAFGKAVHQTLASIEQRVMEAATTLDHETAANEFEERFLSLVETEQPLFDPKHPLASYQALGRKIVQGFLRRRQSAQLPLAVEFPFEIEWEGHLIRGIIDRLEEEDGELTVVEYKTSKQKPSQRALRGDLQLTVYAYAVEEIFGKRPARLIYYHLRDQSALSTERSEDDTSYLTERLLPDVVRKIEAKRFSPHYGWWCRLCPFRILCEEEGPEKPFSSP